MKIGYVYVKNGGPEDLRARAHIYANRARAHTCETGTRAHTHLHTHHAAPRALLLPAVLGLPVAGAFVLGLSCNGLSTPSAAALPAFVLTCRRGAQKA